MGCRHHISSVYLGFYAGEMAWCEDMRRETNGDQYERMTADALGHPEEPILAWVLASRMRPEMPVA